VQSKTLAELTPEEIASTQAALAEMEASRPEATESAIVSTFGPGVIFFEDGHYRAVSRDIATVWPWPPRRLSSAELVPLRY
jgi:hypothetical protein